MMPILNQQRVRVIAAGLLLLAATSPLLAQEPSSSPNAPQASTAPSGQIEPPPTSSGSAIVAEVKPVLSPPFAVALTPYRIHIGLAFEHDASFTPLFQRATRKRLTDRVQRIFGATCVFHEDSGVQPLDWLAPASLIGMERLAEEGVREQVPAAEIDKAFLLLVGCDGSGYRIDCREWDAAKRSLGETISQTVRERERIGDEAAAAVWKAFQPLCVIEDVNVATKTARVGIRAGGLPLGSAEESLIRPGDALVTFLRYFDQKHELKSIQPIPWTYLIVDEVTGMRANCSIASGVRAPLGTNRRRRVESLAIRVRPAYAATTVQLSLQSNPRKKLGGHKVHVAPRLGRADESTTVETQTLLTGRDGSIRLHARPDAPVLWLSVRSGETLLAQVPFVPGVERRASLLLPDDALRLGVERELELLKGRLIESVALRSTITTRALAMARSGDAEGARQELTKADRLPKVAEFESQLTAIRVPATETAQRTKDRLSEGRIKRQSDQVLDLIRQYMAEEKIRLVREEIEQLAETAKTATPSNARPAPRGRR